MNFKALFRTTYSSVLDLIYPPACVFCGKPLIWQNNITICSDCIELLEYMNDESCWNCSSPLGKYRARQKECDECKHRNHKFTRVVAACKYNKSAKEIIHAYKFCNMKHLSSLISHIVYKRYLQEYSTLKFDYIIPVPLHKRKICERGYNQSALIAKYISDMTGFTYSDKLLSRIKYTVSQSLLNSQDRETNLIGAFDVEKPLDNSTILLVDDVFTTGSTISECAYTLKHYGARRVYAIVFAR